MGTLATFTKQPADLQDFDFEYADYLADLSDTGSSHVVEADAGITVEVSTLIGSVVKVWLSGGTSGQSYKITARLTTAGGRVKEAEITVKVKEV